MFDFVWRIAEERIKRAQKEGQFENLKGQGAPLKLEDDSFLPEDLRMSYRLLKNAGCLPPELELRKEIQSLRDLIETLDDDRERLRRLRQLDFKLMKLDAAKNGRGLSGKARQEYEDRLYGRFLGD